MKQRVIRRRRVGHCSIAIGQRLFLLAALACLRVQGREYEFSEVYGGTDDQPSAPGQEEALHAPVEEARRPRRRLSAALPPLDSATTRRTQRDDDPYEDAVPEPHLYYENDVLIWSPEDTLPRDVLRRRPEVWLYTVLSADFDGPVLLPHFLEHYSRLGVAVERMLFVVHHHPGITGGGVDGLAQVQMLLEAFGADYRLWLGQFNEEAQLKVQLQVLARVPVQDWVILADQDEFHDFRELTAQQYLDRKMLDGANYVMSMLADRVALSGAFETLLPVPSDLWETFLMDCDLTGQIIRDKNVKLIAFRAFLRPGIGSRNIIFPQHAKAYFGPAPPGRESPRMSMCGAENLYDQTPYSRWWQYYRSSTMVGNAFLWAPKMADTEAQTFHFKWHSGLAAPTAYLLRHYQGNDGSPCSGMEPGLPRSQFALEAQRVWDGIWSKRRVDLENEAFMCMLGMFPVILPLAEEPARALVRVRQLVTQPEAWEELRQEQY